MNQRNVSLIALKSKEKFENQERRELRGRETRDVGKVWRSRFKAHGFGDDIERHVMAAREVFIGALNAQACAGMIGWMAAGDNEDVHAFIMSS